MVLLIPGLPQDGCGDGELPMFSGGVVLVNGPCSEQMR